MLNGEQDYPEPREFRPERFLRNGKLDHSVRDPMDIGPGKLPLCLCVEMPPKQPQICYFFAPKYAIVDKDIIFPRVTACDPAKNVTFFVKLFRRTAGSRN
jgi:hypothetical protein